MFILAGDHRGRVTIFGPPLAMGINVRRLWTTLRRRFGIVSQIGIAEIAARSSPEEREIQRVTRVQ